MGLYHDLIDANKTKEPKHVTGTGVGIVDLDCAMFLFADFYDTEDYYYAIESMEERILQKIEDSRDR